MARGTDRDRPRMPWTARVFRREVEVATEIPVIRRVLAIGTSTASIAATEVDLTWDTPEIEDEKGTSVSGASITFEIGGTFSFDVTVAESEDNPGAVAIKTLKDTGSGFVELANHVSQGGYLHTALTLDDGDVVKFTAESDAGTLVAAGTILRIVGTSA